MKTSAVSLRRDEKHPGEQKIARVIASIADRMGITQQQALYEFYKSKVAAMMHDPATAMHLMSDNYIVDEFIMEKENT